MAVVQSISVIIPNYNGTDLLRQTLPYLIAELESTGLPHEVIVADDCSTDDSIAFLQTNYPFLKLLENTVNKGFSPTINTGIFAAANSHVLLFNNDVKLTPGYFQGLLRYFERPDTFGVAGRIIGWDNDKIQDGGKYSSFHGTKIKTSGNYIPAEAESAQWMYSMYLSGACALIDREKIVSLNGFDEIFAPFYVEDYELSIRAWRMGWKCYYDHNSICMHKESVTIKTKAKKKQIKKIYNRNKMFLHALHLPSSWLVVWHIQLIIECIANTLLLKFYFPRAFFQYLANLRSVYGKRKSFARLAQRMNKNLLTLQKVARLVRANISQVKIAILK